MNYLESFLEEERSTHTSIPLTDKTDGTTSEELRLSMVATQDGFVSFGSDILECIDTDSPFRTAGKLHPPYLYPPTDKTDETPTEERDIDRLAQADGWKQPDGSNHDALVTPQIDPAVQAELGRIWPSAETLGWTRERIFNLRFWPHSPDHPRGLASVLRPGDTIVQLSETQITILAHRRNLLRFQRNDG